TSRQDHSEVGSGFIHFNFTPWGSRGDKATASLIGDAVHGVLLRSPRIFLGGAGGMVGPLRVGYGSVVGAGGILRRALGEGRLVISDTRKADVPVPRVVVDAAIEDKLGRNVEYAAHLIALREWYRSVRRSRASQVEKRVVLDEALTTLGLAIDERIARL